MSEHSYAAFIGIDWADKKHDICLIDPASGEAELSLIDHTPEAIEHWALSLQKRFGGQAVAVALEQRRGPLIYALRKYDFLTLYPLNPNMLAQYRRTFAQSRAKDDPKDAFLAAELLLRHRERLRPWKPDDPATRELEQLVEMRRRLVNDRKRLTNRLTSTLKAYYPQPLTWFDDLATPLALDFLLAHPTLEAAQGVSDQALEQHFCAHNSRRRQVNARRIRAIRTAQPLIEDPALIRPNSLLVHSLAAQLKTLLTQIRDFDRTIGALVAKHPELHWVASLPASGPVFTARLIAAFGTDRSRYQSEQAMLAYVGVAPVTERSGKSNWVHWRWSAPVFLRQTFVEWAGETIRHSFWARAYYQSQREKGKSHQTAVRALAFKWGRILYRLWQNNEPYDETRYLNALRQRKSPLLKFIAEAAWQ